jgi:hypothetical protein
MMGVAQNYQNQLKYINKSETASTRRPLRLAL